MAAKEYWAFLLQQEGDRAWLPLESPDVEILEGRYRVMARSGHCNVAVDLRITHEATTEMPPKRRTQRRTLQTNDQGMVVVSPFTLMTPGIWEFDCQSQERTTLQRVWQHSVQLHVLPRVEDDWEEPTHLRLVPVTEAVAELPPGADRTLQPALTPAPALTPEPSPELTPGLAAGLTAAGLTAAMLPNRSAPPVQE
jgi:hypothetical protein